MSLSPLGSTPLLVPPFKLAAKLDWKDMLAPKIAAAYHDDPEQYEKQFAILNKIREDMRGAADLGALTARDVLLKYYAHLCLLELRFSFGEKSSAATFTWLDAFYQDSVAQHSISFEKACVIFNVGVSLANLANVVPRDPKVAYQNLQHAAGTFKFISDYFLHAPTFDLSQSTVKFLTNLMLAQAQEMLFEKFMSEDSAKNLCSLSKGDSSSFNIPQIFSKPNTPEEKACITRFYRLTAGAKAMYDALVKNLDDDSKLASNLPKPFVLMLKLKSHIYYALALHFRAPLLEAEGEYGEMVGSCDVAIAELNEALKLSSKIPTKQNSLKTKGGIIALAVSVQEFLENLKSFCALSNNIHRAMHKSNDLIYFAKPTQRSALSPLKPLIVPEPLSFDSILRGGQEELNSMATDIFKSLVTVDVHEKSSIYSHQKDELLRSLRENTSGLVSEIETEIVKFDLPPFSPASETLAPSENGRLTVRLAELERKFDIGAYGDNRSIGGSGLLYTMRQIADETRRMADGVIAAIADQDAKCTAMRDLNGSYWTLPLCSQYDDTVEKCRSISSDVSQRVSADLAEASFFMDTTRGSLITPSSPNFMRLSSSSPAAAAAGGGRSAFDRNEGKGENLNLAEGSGKAQKGPSLLDVDVAVPPSIESLYEKLTDLKEKLSAKTKECQNLVKELELKIRNDDINNLLVLNAKKDMDDYIMEAEMGKFKVYEGKFEALRAETRKIVAEINETHKKIQETPEQKKKRDCANLASTIENKMKLLETSLSKLSERITSTISALSAQQEELSGLKHRSVTLISRYQRDFQEMTASLSRTQAHRDGDILREQLAKLNVSSSGAAALPSASGAAASGYSAGPAYQAQGGRDPFAAGGGVGDGRYHPQAATSAYGGGPSQPPASPYAPRTFPSASESAYYAPAPPPGSGRVTGNAYGYSDTANAYSGYNNQNLPYSQTSGPGNSSGAGSGNVGPNVSGGPSGYYPKQSSEPSAVPPYAYSPPYQSGAPQSRGAGYSAQPESHPQNGYYASPHGGGYQSQGHGPAKYGDHQQPQQGHNGQPFQANAYSAAAAPPHAGHHTYFDHKLPPGAPAPNMPPPAPYGAYKQGDYPPGSGSNMPPQPPSGRGSGGFTGGYTGYN